MSDRIMNIYMLQIGKCYRLITNMGYFDKVCYFKGFDYEWAVFINKEGNREIVHTADLWRDNPIIIKPV